MITKMKVRGKRLTKASRMKYFMGDLMIMLGQMHLMLSKRLRIIKMRALT